MADRWLYGDGICVQLSRVIEEVIELHTHYEYFSASPQLICSSLN